MGSSEIRLCLRRVSLGQMRSEMAGKGKGKHLDLGKGEEEVG